MIIVDESYLNNHTIARIGEEVGIFRLPGEGLREYAIRVIEELQPKIKNEMKSSFEN